jgi:3-deoxy-D-manno-octulosonic-acid transferase
MRFYCRSFGLLKKITNFWIGMYPKLSTALLLNTLNLFLYNALVITLNAGLRVVALFNSKARAFVRGRSSLWVDAQQKLSGNTLPVVWIHCASLGEFEQGRPVIEALKREYNRIKILLTFFSPSGYEVRKNYANADYIFYLPLDSADNARRWVDLFQPRLAIFVKYEFWHHFAAELSHRNIPLLSISSIFRKDQIYFKSRGQFYRNILTHFTYFFVQNDESVKLLKQIGITQCSMAGDTRFDRVLEIAKQAVEIEIVRKFKAEEQVLVIGSCWPEDFNVLAPLLNENKMKFILAPHEISESFLTEIEQSLKVTHIRYSKAGEETALETFKVLIIDNIGLLSRLYKYGELAFVGGAYGKGLHNILEAACYGIPVLFGNKNYKKYKEAVDLIHRGGAFEIADFADLRAKYEMLMIPENFQLACREARQYVEQNTGATEKIMQYCRQLLSN